MLRLRIISAVIGAPIFIAMVWFNEYAFGVTVAVLSIIGLFEYFQPWPNKNIFPATVLGILFGAGFPVLFTMNRPDLAVPLAAALAGLTLVWQVFTPRRARAGIDAGVTVLGSLYAGLLPSYLISTRMLDGGREYVLAAVAAVWACDIAAYCFGLWLGKHKLAPDISPNKTIEGSAAGIVAAIVTASVFAAVGWISWPQAIVLGLSVGVLAQLGDLIASMLKREVGIKDYGKAIPGHGGILDRFDGLFFTAPVIYLLFVLIR